jgi:tetratricopeptide (TPR) repeat protein
MRELSDLRRQEEEKLALDGSNLVNRAKIALSAGSRAEALAFWEEALVRYPHFARSSPEALTILLDLKRFDEAETLMADRLRREPGELDHHFGHALVAERRGDLDAAVRRWAQVRKKFPGEAVGYVHGGICLRQSGQIEAAEALHSKAVGEFPKLRQAWVEWARDAEHRQDWQEAMRRWEAMHERFRDVGGDIGIARALEGLGRITDAEERLKAAQLGNPINLDISVILPRLAYLRGDKDEAVKRWADTRRRFPVVQAGYREGIHLLLEMDRPEEAETILLATIQRFPDEPWPLIEYALVAHRRQDWEAAVARWATVRARWPDRRDSYLRPAEALTMLGQLEEAAHLKDEWQRLSAP